MWAEGYSFRIGPAGEKLGIRSGGGPNYCGTSTQRLEEIMKRTRKSEAAEAKVSILGLGGWELGKGGSRKASRAKEEPDGGGFCVWAEKEGSAEQ